MIPKRIVLQNFLSFGSPETEILFTDDEPLWVLAGPNGVGKSAVFDAMTYALYGEHRGGGSEHTSLIRHGANGFRVTFEFEFNGHCYQIVRNRPLKGRPTQTMKQWADGGWTKSVQLPAGRDQIKLWTERTLGITFDAFKASVLLRQGEADAIITAGGADRLKILKKIIGVERYEQLSEQVHAQARRCKERFEDLQTQRDGLTPISEDNIKAAQNEFAAKEVERRQAHDAHAKAVARVPLAKEWARLDAEYKTLNQKIQDADLRARDAKHIRKDHARLCELTTGLPVLRQLLQLRENKAKAEETLAARQAEAKRLTDAIRAKQLRDEIGRDQPFVDAAQRVKDLKKELAGFDLNLGEQVKAAEKLVKTTTESFTETSRKRAAAEALLGQAVRKQEEFGTLEVGVKCSLCGQPVTAKHATEERERLAADIKQLEKTARKWKSTEEGDKKAKDAAAAEWIRLDQLARKQEKLANELTEKEKTLRAHGVTAKADELRKQLADKKTDIAGLEKEVGDQSRANLAGLTNSLKEVERKLKAEDKTVSSLQGQESSIRGQLAPTWNSKLEKLDRETLDGVEADLQGLVAAGISDLFRKLENDAAQRDGWLERVAALNCQIEEIAADSHVPVADAEQQLKVAKLAASNADNARDAAKKKADDLAAEADRFRKLLEDVGAAETKARLHRKLDDLLGKAGLQRELVRTAEREIVRLANDTVQNLSDGELTIELENAADSDDEAFALQVRRLDGPTPIGVNYLSGSQKFRVAVAVALAIGRFAAGQARPLESVIIDEGFGSLDRDGLRCAAAELNRLRQHLRRIILVSHQEDFADRFPVVIRLVRGENGVIVRAERK